MAKYEQCHAATAKLNAPEFREILWGSIFRRMFGPGVYVVVPDGVRLQTLGVDKVVKTDNGFEWNIDDKVQFRPNASDDPDVYLETVSVMDEYGNIKKPGWAVDESLLTNFFVFVYLSSGCVVAAEARGLRDALVMDIESFCDRSLLIRKTKQANTKRGTPDWWSQTYSAPFSTWAQYLNEEGRPPVIERYTDAFDPTNELIQGVVQEYRAAITSNL